VASIDARSLSVPILPVSTPELLPKYQVEPRLAGPAAHSCQEKKMAKIAKTADRKKVMDTSKSTACPKCGKDTRIVKRTKDRERGVPGGVYISCSACDFYEKL
jgi:DNA-directed RNA polymerase subunit M/transcription elongation factor TFIIS